MNNLTKCGYCCDLCKAYAPNILKSNYDISKYNEYLLAYDNKSRIDEYRRNNKD